MRIQRLGMFGLTVLLCWGCQQPQERAELDDAVACAEAWVEAVRNGDVDRANRCLHSDVRDRGEYSHPEGIAFWRDEIAAERSSLDAEGFEGRWFAREGTVAGRTVVFVFPIVEKGPMDEAIWVVREDGEWRIVSLFTRAPGETTPKAQ